MHVSAEDRWNYLWELFLAQLPHRTETGVRLQVLESENDFEKKTWTLKSYTNIIVIDALNLLFHCNNEDSLPLYNSTQRPTIPETCDPHLADLIECCWVQDAKVLIMAENLCCINKSSSPRLNDY